MGTLVKASPRETAGTAVIRTEDHRGTALDVEAVRRRPQAAEVAGLHILVIGLNHKTAPVEIRERLAFSDDRLGEAFDLLHEFAREGIILSTCNRTEVYALVSYAEAQGKHLARYLSKFHQVAVDDFADHLYCHSQTAAVRHILSVASGIDSMILGEPQILGQVRESYEKAADCNAVGRVLGQLFRHAIRVGRQVRNETEISRNALSVSYAAVELGRKIFGDLRTRSVLIVGAGKMGELTAKTLFDVGVGRVVVTNRTRAHAEELAARFSGQVVDFDDLSRILPLTDIVIASTGSPQFMIGKEMVAKAMQARHQRPLFMIDIAVPRDIDPAVERLSNVYLYNIDDLQGVCEANFRERQKEVKRVEQIVEAEVKKFMAWWDSLDVVPTIAALRDQAETIRQGELLKAYGKLGDLNDDQRETINALTRAIVNKILHRPTVRLKGNGDGAGRDYSRAVRELFDLDGQARS